LAVVGIVVVVVGCLGNVVVACGSTGPDVIVSAFYELDG